MKWETYRRPVPACAPDLAGKPVTEVRSAMNYDKDAVSRSSSLVCPEPTRAQQQFKDECDINNIARNFGLTGRLPENVRMPTYGDFTSVEDYQSALNAAKRAMHSFMAMPGEVRLRFENDPQKFVEFCSDAKNRDEAIKLGLVAAPPVPASVPPPPEVPKPM